MRFYIKYQNTHPIFSRVKLVVCMSCLEPRVRVLRALTETHIQYVTRKLRGGRCLSSPARTLSAKRAAAFFHSPLALAPSHLTARAYLYSLALAFSPRAS